jgi:FKBP-type peptidyl-prolyl cis-trans isomerase
MRYEFFHRIVILTFVLVALLISCRGKTRSEIVVPDRRRHDMTELNRYFVQKDREIIQNYIERKELTMKESSTGLWYHIKIEGSGDLIRDNNKVTIAYECALLDGTKCYSSDIMGPKEIVPGKTDIEQGLYEGLRMLKPGAEAVFIIPPFLAHGLIGDGNKIPPRAILVYEIKVLSVD